MRSAWKTRVAGWMRSRLPGRCTMPAIICANSDRRRRQAGPSCAAPRSRARCAAPRVLPRSERRCPQVRVSLAVFKTSYALCPVCGFIRMSSGAVSRKEKPRLASSSCIDETPKSKSTPSTSSTPHSSRTRRSSEKFACTKVNDGCAIARARSTACGSASIAMRRPRRQTVQNRTSVSTRTKRRIDVDPIRPDRQILERRLQQTPKRDSCTHTISRGRGRP